STLSIAESAHAQFRKSTQSQGGTRAALRNSPILCSNCCGAQRSVGSLGSNPAGKCQTSVEPRILTAEFERPLGCGRRRRKGDCRTVNRTGYSARNDIESVQRFERFAAAASFDNEFGDHFAFLGRDLHIVSLACRRACQGFSDKFFAADFAAFSGRFRYF